MVLEEKEIQQFLMDRGYFEEDETDFNETINFLEAEFKVGEERIDILGVDDKKTFYVIEIKKSVIDANAIIQCKNYMIGLQRILNINSFSEDIKVKGILVGEKIIDSRCKSVISDSDDLEFVTFEKSLDFNSAGYETNKDYYIALKGTAETLCEYAEEYSMSE